MLGCPKRVGSQSGTPDPLVEQKVRAAREKLASGQHDEAQRLLADVAPQEIPELANTLFALAEGQFNARDFGRARDNYRKLLNGFPLFPEAGLARQRLGLAHLALEEHADALQTLAPLYPGTPPEAQLSAAQNLSRAAEGARAHGEAVRWNLEVLKAARDEKTQDEARRRIVELLDSRVPFLEVAKLAQEIPPDSPAWPVVQFKLARILAHLRDYPRLTETLAALLARAPAGPYAKEAKAMLARADKRAQVKAEVLGVALPLSGKYKGFGDSALAGILLGLGETVRVVTRDTAGDPAQARKAVAELAADEQVIGIIGPVLSGESEDGASEAELQETPIVTLTRAEGVTDKGSYVFRNMLTNSVQAKALADYAMRVRGFKRFAVAYPNIAYGSELANFFWDEVEQKDGEMRAAEPYDADQTTFSAVAKKLVGRYYLEEREEFRSRRRQILDTIKDPFRQRKAFEDLKRKLEPVVDFEALFIPDFYRSVGLLTPALAVEDIITNGCDRRDLEKIAKTAGKERRELKTVQLLGGNGWNFNELVERGGKFVNCAVFVDGFFAGSDRKETRAFVAEYKKTVGKEPGLIEAVGYDTARILRSIMEAEKPQSRHALREALLKVKDFPGATGRTTINVRREAEKPLFLLTIDRGQIRELDSDVKT